MKMKSVFPTLLIVCAFTFLPSIMHAQGGPGDPGPGPDQGVPFDGGLSLLVAAGIGYGVKKARDQRKKQGGEVKSEK